MLISRPSRTRRRGKTFLHKPDVRHPIAVMTGTTVARARYNGPWLPCDAGKTVVPTLADGWPGPGVAGLRGRVGGAVGGETMTGAVGETGATVGGAGGGWVVVGGGGGELVVGSADGSGVGPGVQGKYGEIRSGLVLGVAGLGGGAGGRVTSGAEGSVVGGAAGVVVSAPQTL